MSIRVDRVGYSLQTGNVSGTTGSALDLRASNGTFLMTYSASSNGPTAGGSANIVLQHSHDFTSWVVMGKYTASDAAGWATARLAAGPYAYVRATVGAVYSAAQTGTGSVWVHLHGGMV